MPQSFFSTLHNIKSYIPKKLQPFLVHIVIGACVLSGCFLYGHTQYTDTSNSSIYTSSSDADIAFESFTAQLFEDELSVSTLSLYYTLDDPIASGYGDYPITFGNFETSTMDAALSIENLCAQLALCDYNDLSYDNQLTYEVLLDTLTTTSAGTSYLLFSEPLTPYTGLHCQLPVLLAEFTLDSESDVEVYLALLQTLPEYFQSLLDFEETKSAAGLFMSDSSLDSVIVDCAGFIEMEENYLISTFDQRIAEISEISESKRLSYSNENEVVLETYVIPAYEELVNGLENLRGTGTNEDGLCYYENGLSYYAYLVKSNTGSSRSIPELQSLIKEHILQDWYDLDEALALVDVYDDSIYDLEQYFKQYTSSEDMLLDLENDMIYAFPTIPEVNYTIKDVPIELEPYLSPAFYLIPPIDNTSENTIYINNSHMSDSLSLYTTLAHEGYPGHLYQTTYFASTEPAPIRDILSYGGYVEGWAVYTEMCSYYMSDLPSPTNTILQKNASLTLGLYAYADIGIHCDGWDVEDTKDFFCLYGFEDALTIERIYELIVATPTNYLKYYLGYVEFLELKMKCIEEWGEEFSQVRFHTAVLDVGPTSFDVLEKYVLGAEE